MGFKSKRGGLNIHVSLLKITHFVVKGPLKVDHAINTFLISQNIILYFP